MEFCVPDPSKHELVGSSSQPLPSKKEKGVNKTQNKDKDSHEKERNVLAFEVLYTGIGKPHYYNCTRLSNSSLQDERGNSTQLRLPELH